MAWEGLSYDRASTVLAALRQHEKDRLGDLPDTIFNRRSVQVDPATGAPYGTLRFEADLDPDVRAKARERLGESFIVPPAVAGGKPDAYRIEYEQGPQAEPMQLRLMLDRLIGSCSGVKDGHSAQRDHTSGSGTVGWCFELNEQRLGISNWHVFCGEQACSSEPGQTDVLLGGRPAKLVHVAAPVAGQDNRLDFALAEFATSSVICGMVRDDENLPRFDVPLELAKNVPVGSDENFRMAGNETNSRVDQKLTRIADVDYTLHSVRYHFVRQFVFSAGMATHGDSGAVAVRQRDNTVAGLLFAVDRSSHEAYANPLSELLKWEHVGIIPTMFGRFPRLKGKLP
jgi:hypothetical protein